MSDEQATSLSLGGNGRSLSDAYAFERDLQHCVGVREVPGSGHSPHIDQPEAVLAHLRPFVAQR